MAMRSPRRSYRKYRKTPRRVRRVSRLRRPYRRISPIEYKTAAISTSTDLNSTGDIIFLHPLSQGNTDITRVGRKYTIKSINISGQLVSVAAGVARIMLVKVMDPKGVAPTFAQLLTSTSTWALRNRLNLSNLKVLYDRKIRMPAATLGDKDVKALFHIYKKLNDVVVCNDGNAGTIADVEKTAYYLMCFSDVSDGANEMTMGYDTQVKYTDS